MRWEVPWFWKKFMHEGLIQDWLREEYYSNDSLVIFRCRECGQTSLSLGGIHGHIESHRGYTFLNIQIPFTRTSPANFDELMKYTEILRVDETTEIELEEVEEL